ncbi:MAG: tetrahydromethanopterin S-methyltransferase subunit A [Anaerolineales bacterium]|nr:tetrahydromethanopterin S-methyltransferase subunit A [Anaerolineales bacterium]
MLKVNPHPDYPAEEGRFIRGNDFSPVAVAIILNCDEDKIPPDIERLIRTGAESGAALSGSIQTPNIGLEKMICNVVGNPNIRYLILGGPESEGHSTGQALKALLSNGVNDKKRIIGTDALHPYLYNIPTELIERFRQQLTLIDLQFEGDPALIRKAVWSCYQENPVDFQNYELHDPGAFPEEPLNGKITWAVTQPWSEPEDDGEREALERAQAMVERLRKLQRKPGESL